MSINSATRNMMISDLQFFHKNLLGFLKGSQQLPVARTDPLVQDPHHRHHLKTQMCIKYYICEKLCTDVFFFIMNLSTVL